MDDKYDFLEQRDAPIKLSPKQTDYHLFLLKGVVDINKNLDQDEIHEIKGIINKLELSRGQAS